LLAKHLAGETTPEEASAVASWIAASEENLAVWSELSAAWSGAMPHPAVDTEAAWAKVSSRTAEKPAQIEGPNRVFWVMRAAAVILVLVSFSLLFFSKPTPEPEWLSAIAKDDTLQLRLPDGSKVTLNAHSSVSYSPKFADGDRNVRLEGEAFFEVERDPQHPFSIQAGPTTVQVLGTSFSVRTESDAVTVQVETGLVAMRNDSTREQIQLPAGTGGVWKKSSGKLATLEAVGGNDQFWRTRKLKYQAVPLTEVALELEKLFGLELAFGFEGAEKCLFSGKFRGEQPEGILEVIATTFNLTLEKDGTQYKLVGSGC
jgi:ferric-dicitrate binding protein FerR (iron transport regulator)